jgi:hypothetical protein
MPAFWGLAIEPYIVGGILSFVLLLVIVLLWAIRVIQRVRAEIKFVKMRNGRLLKRFSDLDRDLKRQKEYTQRLYEWVREK